MRGEWSLGVKLKGQCNESAREIYWARLAKANIWKSLGSVKGDGTNIPGVEGICSLCWQILWSTTTGVKYEPLLAPAPQPKLQEFEGEKGKVLYSVNMGTW